MVEQDCRHGNIPMYPQGLVVNNYEYIAKNSSPVWEITPINGRILKKLDHYKIYPGRNLYGAIFQKVDSSVVPWENRNQRGNLNYFLSTAVRTGFEIPDCQKKLFAYYYVFEFGIGNELYSEFTNDLSSIQSIGRCLRSNFNGIQVGEVGESFFRAFEEFKAT